MADEVTGIQIEVRWKKVVRQEALRKHFAYPWNIQLSPEKGISKSAFTKRSESTEAESTRSESPEFPVFGIRGSDQRYREKKPPRLPRPEKDGHKIKVEKSADKENVHPEAVDSYRRSKCGSGQLLTFRKREFAENSIERKTFETKPSEIKSPSRGKESESYDALVEICTSDQLSSDFTDTSGFQQKESYLPSPVQDIDLPFQPSEPDSDAEISMTLDYFLDGVNQLKGDLRVLQEAASASKPRNVRKD